MKQSTRRYLLKSGMFGIAGLGLGIRRANAAVSVPVQLQCKLLAKVAKYDRNMPQRVQGNLQVLVAHSSNATSTGVAKNIESILSSSSGAIGGYPTTVRLTQYQSAEQLVATCKSSNAAIVYFSSGLSGEMSSIQNAFNGMSMLTVAAEAQDVQSGAVLGFDLREGKPKVLIHLARAKAQNVAFQPALLKLASLVDA